MTFSLLFKFSVERIREVFNINPAFAQIVRILIFTSFNPTENGFTISFSSSSHNIIVLAHYFLFHLRLMAT